MKLSSRVPLIGLVLIALSSGCRKELPPGVVEIRVAYWGKVQESRLFEELARRFMAKHPNIRVKLEHIVGMDYHKKVLAMTIGNCAPDVLSCDDEQFRQLADNGLYEDLTPYLARDKSVDPAAFYPEFRSPWIIDGRTIAIPYCGNCLVIFYNRDERRAAGLLPDPNPDWTWDEFDRDARALTRDLDGDGRTDQFGFNRTSWYYCVQWIWSAGGQEMDPAMTRYLFRTPAAKRGFQFHYDHMHKYHVCPGLAELPNMNVESQFLTGRVAMVLAGSWWMLQARQAKHMDWDIAPLPRGPVGRWTRATSEAFAISRQSMHKPEAWKWIKFSITDEAQELFAKSSRGIPAVRRVALKTYANPATPWHEERFLEAMDQYARTNQLHKRWMACESIFNREWDRVYAGSISIDEFIENTVPEADAIVQGDDL